MHVKRTQSAEHELELSIPDDGYEVRSTSGSGLQHKLSYHGQNAWTASGIQLSIQFNNMDSK